MVIDGRRSMQGYQGIAYVGQRLVQLFYRSLQAIIRRDKGG